jgi:uncharacterized protein involved in exopolysaccharide biosynthesis
MINNIPASASRGTARGVATLLYRRKLVVAGFFVCALAGGYAGLRMVSPVYRATAQVMVNLGQEDIFMPLLPSSSSEVRTPLSTGRLEQRANSEIRVIESEPLVAQVVARFGPAGLFPGIDVAHPWYTPKGIMQRVIKAYREIGYYFYPLSANETLDTRAQRLLMKSINTTQVKDSTVIEVTMDSAIPEIAVNALNELVRLYLQERNVLYQREDNGFYNEQLTEVIADLEKIDHQLDAFRTDNNILDLDVQREGLLNRLVEVNANLQNETVAIAGLQKRIGTLERQEKDNASVAFRIRDDSLKSQSELAAHQESAAQWTRIHADLTVKVEALNRVQSASAQLLQRQKVLQDNRKLYLQKVEETRVQQAMRQAQIGDVVVINWASVDYSLISPKLGMVLGGVLGVGLIGGIGLALFLGFMDDRILMAEDVVSASGLPVIGRVRMPLASVRLG